MSTHFLGIETIPETIYDGISLDTVVLEQEMQTNNGGVDIADPYQNYVIQEDFLRQFVPHFFTDESNPDCSENLAIANKYPDITSPCSILVDSVQDVQDIMAIGYQVAHFNYILGKKHNQEPFLCFDSNKNVEENKWHHFAVVVSPNGNTGYLNGVEITNRRYNFGNSKDSSFLKDISGKTKLMLGYGRSSYMLSPDFIYFKGALDDVRIYDKPLTTSEIKELI
ncbi:hypothetical protein CEE44_00125 [Candidatus Woesearchaeota archaeon B3_Woes]|nr:MAG: hypothetical protein CEE44_00125 [Candidatus Woesearchaeota archaeon B3_Woes]